MFQPERPSHSSSDLLPTSFRVKQQARQAIVFWTAVNLALAAGLIGIGGAMMIRAARTQKASEELAARAIPIANVRTSVKLVRAQVTKKQQWCDWIESAKPNDDVLQTIAQIANATAQTAESIDVERIAVRLPLEYNDKETPDWATPTLEIEAALKVDDEDEKAELIKRWTERLNNLDRVSEIEIAQGIIQEDQQSTIQLRGKPIASRYVP